MESNIQRVKKIIHESNLLPDQQFDLITALLSLSQDELELIKNLMTENNDAPRVLHDNYKRKQNAILTKDRTALMHIIEEEKSLLDKLN